MVDLLHRLQLPGDPPMAGLAALLAALQIAPRLALRGGRIRGRRLGGVARVLPEPFSQLGDLGLQVIERRDLLAQDGELLLVSGEAETHQAQLVLE